MKKFFLGFVIGGAALYFTISLKPSLVVKAEVKASDTIKADSAVAEISPAVNEITPVLKTTADTAK